jgi:hypothetical protein
VSSTPPTPPEEDAGPAFPGLKMGLGAAEHHPPAPPSSVYTPQAPAPMDLDHGRRWPRVAFWLAVLIAALLIAWLLLA